MWSHSLSKGVRKSFLWNFSRLEHGFVGLVHKVVLHTILTIGPQKVMARVKSKVVKAIAEAVVGVESPVGAMGENF